MDNELKDLEELESLDLDLENVRIYSNTKTDIEDAMNLIGEKVYLSDSENFDTYIKGVLIGVSYVRDDTYTKYPYICRIEDALIESHGQYKYFILEKDAKFKKKELRPFNSIQEFIEETECDIGDIITITYIKGKYKEIRLFNGYRTHLDTNVTYVILGGTMYSFEELKDYHRYYKDGEWHPFGKIE